MSKLTRDSIESEISSIDALLSSLDSSDIVGRSSLEYRRDQIMNQLEAQAGELQTLGKVTLSFEGGPVSGSRAIDAEFAASAIHSYQELIAKQMAAVDSGGLARSGPVPSRDLSRLNITDIRHGSFGFHLEERASDEPQLVNSSVKEAIKKVDDIIAAFASSDYESFNTALAVVDRRVFISLRDFYENLYRDSASMKIIEDDRELVLDNNAIVTARDRIKGTHIEDDEFSIEGELLGLTPISRRFDFQPSNGSPVMSGQVGQRLSDDYLERLHREERIAGRIYVALLSRRTATRVDGSVSTAYVLLDLQDPAGTQLLPSF